MFERADCSACRFSNELGLCLCKTGACAGFMCLQPCRDAIEGLPCRLWYTCWHMLKAAEALRCCVRGQTSQ